MVLDGPRKAFFNSCEGFTNVEPHRYTDITGYKLNFGSFLIRTSGFRKNDELLSSSKVSEMHFSMSEHEF